MSLKVLNTLTKKVDVVASGDTAKVYVCGVTPYDHSHVGHGRCYVVFDTIVRILQQTKPVTYVRNFTDIDDKILSKSRDYKSVSDTYIKSFHEDMDALGCQRPTHEPRVTDHIQDIIEFVQELIELGYAYESEGDVYFEISKFSEYGKLSGRKLEDLIAGVRVEVSQLKKNPGDFALWKKDAGFWQSPWGEGRPGWHIECSTLCKKFLGDTIDLHGGGMDLIFPHHENEVAQSESLSKKALAKVWVHNAFVNVDKEKMSKSLGNVLSLKDVFKDFNPMVLRLYYLQHHYRTPMDFSLDGLKSAEKAYRKLVRAFSGVEEGEVSSKVLDALNDDLNTTKALGVVFDNLGDPGVKGAVVNILGLSLKEIVNITPEIQKIIDDREAARAQKDWARSDELRKQLEELGVEVHDKKLS